MINSVSSATNYKAYHKINIKNDKNSQDTTPVFQGKSKLLYAVPITATLVLATLTGCAVHKNDTKPVKIEQNVDKSKIDLNKNITELINFDDNEIAKDLKVFNNLDISENNDITTLKGSLLEQDFALNIKKSDNGVLISGNIDKEKYGLSINRSDKTIKGSLLGTNINCEYLEDNENLVIMGKYGDKDINIKLVNEDNQLKIKNFEDKTICRIMEKDGKLDFLYDEKLDVILQGGFLGACLLGLLGVAVKYKIEGNQIAEMYALKCALSDLSISRSNKSY